MSAPRKTYGKHEVGFSEGSDRPRDTLDVPPSSSVLQMGRPVTHAVRSYGLASSPFQPLNNASPAGEYPAGPSGLQPNVSGATSTSNFPALGASYRRLPPIHHPSAPAPPQSMSEPARFLPPLSTNFHRIGTPPTGLNAAAAATSRVSTATIGQLNQAKPLPAIAEPSPKENTKEASKHQSSPCRIFLRCFFVCVFLSIPVIIFVIMMALSGGFAPLESANSTLTSSPPATSGSMGTPSFELEFTTVAPSVNATFMGQATTPVQWP